METEGKGDMAGPSLLTKQHVGPPLIQMDAIMENIHTAGQQKAAETSFSTQAAETSNLKGGTDTSSSKDAADNTTTPWLNLFHKNRGISSGLKLEKKEVGDVVKISKEQLLETNDAWGICLIGYALGRFPGYKAVDALRNFWKVPCLYFVHSSGWTVFKFQQEEDRQKVLDNGPYASSGQPWVLKHMPPLFRFDDDKLSKVPTWVQLPKLPLEMWSGEVLSMITSSLGVPLATDKFTEERSKPSYARVLVEVDASKPLLKMINIELSNGTTMEQEVIYEFEPSFCSKCHSLGHETDICEEMKEKKRNRRGRSKTVRRNVNTAPRHEVVQDDLSPQIGDVVVHDVEEPRVVDEVMSTPPVNEVVATRVDEEVEEVQDTVKVGVGKKMSKKGKEIVLYKLDSTPTSRFCEQHYGGKPNQACFCDIATDEEKKDKNRKKKKNKKSKGKAPAKP